MSRLSEITVLVTDAASELGRATVGRLVAEGALVVAATSIPVEHASPHEFGPRVTMVELEVADSQSWDRAIVEISGVGDLHGVVNTAMSVLVGPLANLTPDDLRSMVDINLLGSALAIQKTAPLLEAAKGGSIVTLAGTEPAPGQGGAAALAATHWAVRGLTRAAASELGPSGIRINTVSVASALLGGDVAQQTTTALADSGRPRASTWGDVAAMVAFLMSDDSATCTGGDFVVDAG